MRSRPLVLSAFILFATLLFPAHSFAQATSFGVQGGVNLANVSFTAGDPSEGTPDFKSRTRGVFGGFVARDFNPNVGLQVDFLYSQKGTKATGSEDGFNFEFEIGVDTIEIPVLIRANIAGSGGVKARVFGGPAFGFKVRDQTKFTVDGVVIPDEDTEEADFKSSEVGFVIGGAVQFGRVFVDVRYNWGLTNLVGDDGTGDVAKSRTLGFMVGYQIK